jgi:hypothetical protein
MTFLKKNCFLNSTSGEALLMQWFFLIFICFKVKFQSIVKCNTVPDPKAIHEDDDNLLFSGSMHVKIAAIAAPIECAMI